MTLTRALVGALLIALALPFVAGSDRRRADRAVLAFAAARSAGDGDAGCAVLSARQRTTVAEALPGGRTCAESFAAVARATRGVTGGPDDAVDRVDRQITVDGGRARVKAGNVGAFLLVKEHGEWKVDDWVR